MVQVATTAKRVAYVKTLGTGCIAQALALLVVLGGAWCWFFGAAVGFAPNVASGFAAVGVVAGLMLAVAGRSGNTAYRCGACGNPLASKEVMLCPTCKATIAGAEASPDAGGDGAAGI